MAHKKGQGSTKNGRDSNAQFRGVKLYERTLVPLMFLMFALGAIVIVAGFAFDANDFSAAVLARDGRVITEVAPPPFRWGTFLAASAILFSSFIGFDSIAQAGGEAKRPGRSIPLAIGIAVVTVGTFYMLFTAAMYHVVPWSYIAEEAMTRDLTAPGLLGYLLSPGWTVAIVFGAAVAPVVSCPAALPSARATKTFWQARQVTLAPFTLSLTVYCRPHCGHCTVIAMVTSPI